MRSALLVELGIIVAILSQGGAAICEEVALFGEDGEVDDAVLETLLSPGEFKGRVLVHVSEGEEAAYALDSSLGSEDPFAELRPDRLPWPDLAGLGLRVEGAHLKLKPASDDVDDDTLDKGFIVRWVFEPLGQRFEETPHFAVRVVEAEVLGAADGKRLLFWTDRPPPACTDRPKEGFPNCSIDAVGLETKAVAVSPKGALVAIAIGGIRPRIEVYDISKAPVLLWQALFPIRTGAPVETAFSSDGKWVVALSGLGEMHRWRSDTGEDHMAIPSSGRAARTVPPGQVMAVGGDLGEVTFWYLQDGTISWRLPPRRVRGAVDRLASSGDGARFATLEYDESGSVVRVWAIRRRAMLAEIEVDPYVVTDVALDREGKRLYVAHERKGLLVAEVKRDSVLQALGSETKRCRGRLEWVDGAGMVSCATEEGELRFDSMGRMKSELRCGTRSSEWIFATSRNGTRLVAVGGGRLLVWRVDG